MPSHELFWDYHPHKEIMRSFVLPENNIKNGIWLPADLLLCVEKPYRKGLLDEASAVILVEEERNTYEKMVDNAIKMGLPNVRFFLGKLENLTFDHPIDYAYLDFLGGMKESICNWIYHVLSPKIEEDAVVAITQIFAPRNNKIFADQKKLLWEEEGRLIRKAFGVKTEKLQQFLILIHRVFRDWDFEIEMDDAGEIPHYQDTQISMLLFKLTGFRKLLVPKFRPLEFSARSSV